MDRFTYAYKKGLAVFFANISRNLASMVTISTLLFFYLAVFSVNYSAAKAIEKLSDIKTIRIFLEEGVQKEEMIKSLSELQMPVSFNYFDKKAAKQRVLDLVPGAKNLEKLPVELFPEFIEMIMADYAAVDGLMLETATQIEKMGGVRSVEYGRSVGHKMEKVRRTSFIFMIFISILTGVSASVIIFNTIRLSLYQQRKKIVIYNVVGATKMFITAPYLFASFIEAGLGFAGALTANFIFIRGVQGYLLKESYFILYTPPLYVYALFFALLSATAVAAAFFSVMTFLMRLKSINEI
jgi:cell division transport system permease protein